MASSTASFNLLSITSSTTLINSKTSSSPASVSIFSPICVPKLFTSTSSSRYVKKLGVASSFDMELDEDLSSDGDDEQQQRSNFSPDLKVYVGNLPWNVDSAALAGLFQRAGNVEMVEVVYDKISGRSRGFGFVTMSSAKEVEAATRQFNGYELDGRQLRVNSGPPPAKGESSFRGQRDGGRSSYGSEGSRGGYGGGGGGGRRSDDTNKLYVGNLAWSVDNLALETLFQEQGNVMEARVVYDRDSGRSKGFGFVTFGSADEVNKAIESLDGVDVDGRSIRVTVAEARQRPQY
ncbi:29 kDa ribonucleoprotein A, chloroplastic-like protein [Tanacetum coccineum]